MIASLLAGLGLSIVVSLLGLRAGALGRGGVIAATLVGTSVIAGLSWPGAVVLGIFFVTTSGLSRVARPATVSAKGSRRDAGQVLANGGIALACGALALWIDVFSAFVAASGSLAAAAADSWATEVGSLSRRSPRLLLSRRVVQPGRSGGVTTLGTLAGLAGALAIGIASASCAAAWAGAAHLLPVMAAVAAAGTLGALADSALGELLQERRRCLTCGAETEAHIHRCGAATVRVGGVRGVTNDVVNVGCTLVGAVTAVTLS